MRVPCSLVLHSTNCKVFVRLFALRHNEKGWKRWEFWILWMEWLKAFDQTHGMPLCQAENDAIFTWKPTVRNWFYGYNFLKSYLLFYCPCICLSLFPSFSILNPSSSCPLIVVLHTISICLSNSFYYFSFKKLS